MFKPSFYLSKNCVQAVSVVRDKPVPNRTQVVLRFVKKIINPVPIHNLVKFTGKLHLVLSPVFPQPNTYISQMERVVYAQYPQSLLLRLLFNIIRERTS